MTDTDLPPSPVRQPTPEEAERAARAAAEVYARMTALFHSALPVLQQLIHDFNALGRMLQECGFLTADGRPVTRRGVAAQRSPYGPQGKRPRRPRRSRTKALGGNATADALAAELHRRSERLAELRKDPGASEAVRQQVDGEVIGLRGAVGVALGARVPGGKADELGAEYYGAWRARQ